MPAGAVSGHTRLGKEGCRLLKELLRLASGLELGSLKVDSSLCVRVRSRRAECECCLSVCPTQGIHIGPAVEIKSCLLCGLCTAACPTGVFELQENSDGSVLLAVERLAARWASVVFACDRSPRSVVRRPDRVAVRCAGRVSAELLVAALSLGAQAAYLYLDPAGCAGCHGKQAKQAASTAVAGAQAIASAYGLKAPLSLTAALPPPRAATDSRRPAAEGVDEGRRALLTAVNGVGVKSALKVALGTSAPEPGFAWRHSLPKRRRILLEALARLALPGPAGAGGAGAFPWPGLTLAGGCTFCGACVPLCPSAALKLEEAGEEGRLLFYPARCTFCGLCLASCPEGALACGREPALLEFLSGEPRVLSAACARRCAGCGRPFLSTDLAQRYCVTCRIRRQAPERRP
ncbi:MAG: hypothetical protein PWR31_1587 [Bacillota bacterium]|nr:hypothetical protein [Bacillota bacterium]